MSPFGSRIFELIRAIALRTIPDPLRKKIKNAIVHLKRVPLKITGMDRIVDSQRAEMDRMKSRITLLQGKLNAALYGLPHLGPFQAVELARNVLAPEELSELAMTALKKREEKRAIEETSTLKAFLKSGLMSGFQPRSTFFIGIRSSSTINAVLNHYPTIKDCSGSDPTEAENLNQKVSSFRFFSSDAISSLMGSQRKYDLIALGRFAQAVPREQIQILDLSIARLEKNGILALFLPNPSFPEEYWSDPENLRPISLSMIHSLLENYPGKMEVPSTQNSSIIVAFRKS